MAVDQRRLELHAGRSSASTRARAPGNLNPDSFLSAGATAPSAGCLHGPQGEAPAGHLWNLLMHRKSLKLINIFSS